MHIWRTGEKHAQSHAPARWHAIGAGRVVSPTALFVDLICNLVQRFGVAARLLLLLLLRQNAVVARSLPRRRRNDGAGPPMLTRGGGAGIDGLARHPSPAGHADAGPVVAATV